MHESELLDAAFRPLAGPAFFRGNVLRLTGLPPGASTAQIRRRRTEVEAAARLGMAAPPAAAGPACGPPPTAAETTTAFDDLRREPVLRLVHELLWIWSSSDDPADDPADELSDEHDAVVHAHCALLAEDWPDERPAPRTVGSDERWAGVLAGWAHVLSREDLWHWVRRRAGELSDPRVTDRVVDRLRARLPVELLAVNADLAARCAAGSDTEGAARHVAVLRGSPLPADAVDTAVHRHSRPAKRQVGEVCETANGRAAGSPDLAPGEATALLERTAAPLRVLTALLGADDPATTAARDDVASALNTICVRYYEHSSVDRRARATAVRAQLDAALELATDRHLRDRVAENVRILAANNEVIEHYVRNAVGMALPPPGPTAAEKAERLRIAEQRRLERAAEWEVRLAAREERLRIAREREAAAEAQRLAQARAQRAVQQAFADRWAAEEARQRERAAAEQAWWEAKRAEVLREEAQGGRRPTRRAGATARGGATALTPRPAGMMARLLGRHDPKPGDGR